MKRIAGLVVALVAVFSLTACGNSTKYDFTCTGKMDGVDGTVSGIVSDGKVTKLVMQETMEASSTEEAKAGVDTFNGMSSLFAASGVSVKAKASGKKVVVDVEIDVAKAAKAAEESDDEDDEDFSMSFIGDIDLSNLTKDAIVKSFESQGFTCK